MTWYRNGRRIGDHRDVAKYMLGAVDGAVEDETAGPEWERSFLDYMDQTFTPSKVLEDCERGCGRDVYFTEWVEDIAKNFTHLLEMMYGFEWRDDE